jgi:hypothetical protein
MAERPSSARLPDDLVREALFYASGELDPDAAEAFERRLGEDALAQSALIDAVQLGLLVGHRPTVPNQAYRSAVRRSCLPGARDRVARLRWAARVGAFGLVAATLFAATPLPVPLSGAEPGHPTRSVASAPQTKVTANPAPTVDVARNDEQPAATEPEKEGDMRDTAREWAEIGGCGDHLQRTLDEEARRKARQRDRHRAGVDGPD